MNRLASQRAIGNEIAAPAASTPNSTLRLKNPHLKPPEAPKQPAHTANQPVANMATTQRLHPRKEFHPPPKTTTKAHSSWQYLQLPLAILTGVTLGFFVQSVLLGQLAVILYGIAAIIWRLESRTSFTLALLSIAAAVIMLFTQNSIMMAHNFASYAFLLLLVGIICAAREARERRSLLAKKRGPQRFRHFRKLQAKRSSTK